jgi:4-aminobutyrate aminotransferase-like enzyme
MIRKNIIYNSASDWIFDFSGAKGVYLWTANGKKLLDFTSGWNVSNLGWNNGEIQKAMITQIKKNLYAPMETSDPVQLQLAELLTKSLPKNLVAIGRTTGGVESNEEAIKTARAYTGRSKILGFYHAYHGQSLSMLSMILKDSEMSEIGPRYPNFLNMEYPATYKSDKNEIQLLKEFSIKFEQTLAKKDIAAVLVEPCMITGWGSSYVAPSGFTKLIRKLTKKYKTLLILDEVGTGFSRCGELFGMNIEEVEPDIATFAKGFSNGAVAIGAMVTTKEIAEKTWKVTNLQSTFGWTPVACAAALKNLEIHLRDKVWMKAKKDGEFVRKVLKKELLHLECVGDVRGLGMEIGVTFVRGKDKKVSDEELPKKIMKKCFERGLYVLYGDDGNIQLMPPLIIKRSDLEKGLDIFVKSVKDSI